MFFVGSVIIELDDLVLFFHDGFEFGKLALEDLVFLSELLDVLFELENLIVVVFGELGDVLEGPEEFVGLREETGVANPDLSLFGDWSRH